MHVQKLSTVGVPNMTLKPKLHSTLILLTCEFKNQNVALPTDAIVVYTTA